MECQRSPDAQARLRRRKRVVLLIAVCLVAAWPALIVVNFGYYWLWGAQKEIVARQKQLLYKTNPNALLAAARQIHASAGTYRPHPTGQPQDNRHPDPNDPNMPLIVKGLLPSTIAIDKDIVQIEMGGGFYHYGVIAYMTSPTSLVPMGTLQLTPGLWYYAEDGRVPPP